MNKQKTIYLLIVLLSLGAAGNFMCQPKRTSNSQKELEQLGRYLFFDNRLSYNQTKSCASCHDPSFAFTDGYRRSITAFGDNVLHNAPTLINVSKQYFFDWANPQNTALTVQHRRPLFGNSPPELGMADKETVLLQRLQQDSMYQRLFTSAFSSGDSLFSTTNIITALAAYVQSLQSTQSPYDKYIAGNKVAIDSNAIAGIQLFIRLGCNNCHAGNYFTTATITRNIDSVYFNTGLYNVGNTNNYPAGDTGIPGSNGRYKVPTLRNLTFTAPYMHDGSVATLSEVIDIYASGGRKIITGPLAGDGATNSHKSPLLKGFSITTTEKRQLLNFLLSLTDSTILSNPQFVNPFDQRPTR